MSPLAFTGLVNFITSFSLSVFVLIKNPGENRNRAFFAGAFLVSVFSLVYFLWLISSNPDDALFWIRILTYVFIILNAGFLHFVFVLVDVAESRKKELIFFYILNSVSIVLNSTPYVYLYMIDRGDVGFWPVVSPYFHFISFLWVAQTLYGLFWLVKGLLQSTGIRREQIKFFAIGIFVAFIGGGTNFLLVYGINIAPYGNITISAFIIIIAYTIIKYRFLNIKVVFTQAGIFIILYTLVLGIPFAIGLYTGYWVASMLTMFILATLGPIIFRFIETKAENVILANQKRYQKFLIEASKGIVREHNINRLLKLIVYMITRAVKIEYSVIFTEDVDNGNYPLRARRGAPAFPADYVFSKKDSLIEHIKQQEKPFIHESGSVPGNEFLNKTNHVIVPCMIEERLLGFLILGEKRDRTFYSEDDFHAFELLSKEAALAIDNCYYIEEHNRVHERLFQSEKLSIIGGMAEGVAHQIKNRLNFFSLSASGIQLEVELFLSKYNDIIEKEPDLKKTFEVLEDISKDLVKNVRKTDDVIRKVIDYARIEEKENSFSEFSIRSVLDIAATLAQIKHDFKSSPLKIDIEKSDTVYGIKSQVLESIFNLIDNCYEAIEEKRGHKLKGDESLNFEPIIKFRLTQNINSTLIEVTDNGIGIKEEDKKKIFAPYFSTKTSFKTKSNTGVGMFLMYRFIEESHNGKIWFDSEYMKGTSFFIKLPRKR